MYFEFCHYITMQRHEIHRVLQLWRKGGFSARIKRKKVPSLEILFTPPPSSHRRRGRRSFLPFSTPLPSRNDQENCPFINTRRRLTPGDTFRQPFVFSICNKKMLIIWKTTRSNTVSFISTGSRGNVRNRL